MSKNRELLKDHLEHDEGRRRKAYKDSKGYWTIGVGHLLDRAQTDRELEIMGLSDELDDWEGFEITEPQIDALLENDIDTTLRRLKMSFDEVELEQLAPDRYIALFSMGYQLGSVIEFPSMVSAVKRGDWDRAADEMLWSNGLKKQRRSQWYKDTPKRCQKMAGAIRFGYFEKPQEVLVTQETLLEPLADYSDDAIREEYDRRFGIEAPLSNVEDSDPESPRGDPELVDDRISAADLGNALLHQIVIQHNAREEVMVPETGEMVKVQPFRLTDSRYRLPTKDEVLSAIEKTKVDEIEYVAEEWDCEDFARRFVSKMHDEGIKTAGRVMAWSGNHAFNIVAIQHEDGTPTFMFVEPQTDTVLDTLEDLGKDKYNIENCLIIIS